MPWGYVYYFMKVASKRLRRKYGVVKRNKQRSLRDALKKCYMTLNPRIVFAYILSNIENNYFYRSEHTLHSVAKQKVRHL